MNLIIFSDFDCILMVDNNSYLIKSGMENNVSLSQDDSFLRVCPTCCGGLCEYSFALTSNINEFNSNNVFAKLYRVDRQNCLLRLYKKQFVSSMVTLDKISTLFNDYEVYQDEKLNIICGGETIITRNLICNRASVTSHNNLIFFELFAGDKNHLIVLNEQNEIILEDDITSIEQTTQGFLSLTKFASMQKQGLVKKYQLSNDKLVLAEEYAVYLKNSPKTLYNTKLTKLAFFESARVKNLSLCKQYLSQELSNKISQNHLSQYFGDFDEVYDLSHLFNQNTVTLVDSKKGKAKTYLIDIQNEKIANISPLE